MCIHNDGTVQTEVIVRGPPGSHVHPPPPRAEPKWYQNDRMNLLFQNRDVPIKNNLDPKHLICIKQDGRRKNYEFTFFVISPLIDGIFM